MQHELIYDRPYDYEFIKMHSLTTYDVVVLLFNLNPLVSTS